MTITQVKEINEKIIEMVNFFWRRRFDVRCLNDKTDSIRYMLSHYEYYNIVITALETACSCILSSYEFETRYNDTDYAEIRFSLAKSDINHAIENRYQINDDISIDELSLWIDLFTLIY